MGAQVFPEPWNQIEVRRLHSPKTEQQHGCLLVIHLIFKWFQFSPPELDQQTAQTSLLGCSIQDRNMKNIFWNGLCI